MLESCSMQPIFLGIVGQIASGKGEVVKILTEQYGFVSFNLSLILHKILDEKGITNFTRADLQDLGDKLRKEEGEGVLAKRAIKEFRIQNLELRINNSERKNQNSKFQIPDSKFRIVIEGIRNPAEVNYLRTLPNFKLIAVKAKRQTRFERLKNRGKLWDPKTWKEFIVIDRRDKGLRQKKYGQQVEKCMKMADEIVQNNGSIKLLNGQIDKLLKENFYTAKKQPFNNSTI